MKESAPTLYDRFESWAINDGGRIAARCGQETIRYADLALFARMAAGIISSHEAPTESMVGLCMRPGLAMIAAVLGVARVGAAYVPLDPSYPTERLRWILEEVPLKLVLATPAEADNPALDKATVITIPEWPETLEGELNQDGPPVHPDQGLYVLFTSGSTGRPKGVVVTHRNMLELLDAALPFIKGRPTDVWSLFHSAMFDFSAWELWGALTSGAKLVVVPDSVRRSSREFYALLVREGVSILNQTPASFYALMAVDTVQRDTLAVNTIVFGGERLDLSRVAAWRSESGRPGVRLINMYGTTETTVHATAYEIGEGGGSRPSVIGKPLGHLSTLVVDNRLNAVAAGQPGELMVGGSGVSRGYLHRPALTAERYIPDPSGSGTRMYRTGDQVIVTKSGDLVYKGRLDFQLKVRGHRIEPEEVEATLREHPLIRGALVTTSGTENDRALRAYVQIGEGGALTYETLRAFLRERLPDYLVPSSFMACEELPTTPSGKLDRTRADAISSIELAPRVSYVQPTDVIEERVCAVFCRALGLERVGMLDNFFELGGHSLMLVDVVMELKQAYPMDVTLQTFFAEPTAKTLADIIKHQTSTEEPTHRAAEMPDDEAYRALLPKVARPQS